VTVVAVSTVGKVNEEDNSQGSVDRTDEFLASLIHKTDGMAMKLMAIEGTGNRENRIESFIVARKAENGVDRDFLILLYLLGLRVISLGNSANSVETPSITALAGRNLRFLS
jgi:hypothetical protein